MATSSSAKQTPLGLNEVASHLDDIGFYINPQAEGYMGVSKYNSNYTLGSIVKDTCLIWLTYSIHIAYGKAVDPGGSLSATTYNNLIKIGLGVMPVLGNSPPSTYTTDDPTNRWNGQANTGYYTTGDIQNGQSATWLPYSTTNDNVSVTQWGYIRLIALQAWNEFNWNGKVYSDAGFDIMPEYKDFVSSFLAADSFYNYVNKGINAFKGSKTFLKGTYSNMNDLTSADVAGVTLATSAFGQDCITAGRVIDLSKIQTFGLPSVLLQTIKKNNCITQSLTLALLASGLTAKEIDEISKGVLTPVSKEQERKLYGAYLIIVGQDLQAILFPMNCKTLGLNSLADLLSVKKLFPNSYLSLTVPIYNANPGPTNSKTYYPIYERNSVNVRIDSPEVKAQVGSTIPPGEPPIIIPPPPVIPPAILPSLPAPNPTPAVRYARAYAEDKEMELNGFGQYAASALFNTPGYNYEGVYIGAPNNRAGRFNDNE